jgi:hypothetical protein
VVAFRYVTEFKEVPGPLLKQQLFTASLIVTAVIRSGSGWGVTEISAGNDVLAEVKVEKKPAPRPTAVTLAIVHGIELPWGKPGFRIQVSNWVPLADVSVSAIGPDGERIDLVSANDHLGADPAGKIVIDIDYERKGLKRGHWVIVVAGKPGIHVIQTNMP